MKNFLHGRRSRKKEVTPGTFSIHASAFFLHACPNPQESGSKLQKYQHCENLYTCTKRQESPTNWFYLVSSCYLNRFNCSKLYIPNSKEYIERRHRELFEFIFLLKIMNYELLLNLAELWTTFELGFFNFWRAKKILI